MKLKPPYSNRMLRTLIIQQRFTLYSIGMRLRCLTFLTVTREERWQDGYHK